LPRLEHIDSGTENEGSANGKWIFDRDNIYGDIDLILPTNISVPHPPYPMIPVEKYGMGYTIALTELVIVIPVELVLLTLTGAGVYACLHGAGGACIADIPLVVADVAIADFGVSLVYMVPILYPTATKENSIFS